MEIKRLTIAVEKEPIKKKLLRESNKELGDKLWQDFYEFAAQHKNAKVERFHKGRKEL